MDESEGGRGYGKGSGLNVGDWVRVYGMSVVRGERGVSGD
jgi:hypothetical protein